MLIVSAGLMLASLLPTNANAQEIPTLSENQKSVVLFDVRLDQAWEELKQIGMAATQEQLKSLPMEGPFEGIELTDIKRVFGSVSLPENFNDVMGLMMGPTDKLPMEFFIRIEFAGADAVEAMETNFKKEFEKTIDMNGKEYISMEGDLALAHRVDETTFEIGTKSYLLQKKRNFFTDRLKEAYKTAPNDPIRIVIDLETRADFIAQAVTLGKSQVDNPIVEAYLDLVDNAKSIVFTQGMASENLMTLLIEGVDQTESEELKDALLSVLGIAKAAGAPMLRQMSQESGLSDKTIKMMNTMLSELNAEQEGTRVSVVVARPEGFKEAVAELQIILQAQAKKAQKMNPFRQIALSVLNFESVHQKFPFVKTKGMHEDLSWRVKVLPFLDFTGTYDQLALDKPPTDEVNAAFIDKMPLILGAEGKNSTVSWIKSEVTSFGDITDGSSNTIMLIENPNGGPWMENNPISIDDALKLVSELKDDETLVAVRYDGSALVLNKKMDKENLRNMLDPKDGNILNR